LRRATAGVLLLLAAAPGGPAAGTDLPPLASLERSCQLIDRRLASVDYEDCGDAGLRTGLTASVQGQPLLWRDYRSAREGGNRQRILLIGGIHGDEFSSVSIAFQWMGRLAADATQPFYWRVMPVLNPDGLLRAPATRTNARGVDLNRNFPTPEWQDTALPYWIQRTGRDPRRYPGPVAQSEPETRWLLRHIERFRPHAIVSVHAPYGVLDYDGPREPPQQLGFLKLHLLGTYPGSLGNYAGLYRGVPVITLELPHAGIMPTPAQAGQLWADLLLYLERNLPEGAPLRSGPLFREPWRAALPQPLPPVPPFSDWLP
jgi:protein MpaA